MTEKSNKSYELLEEAQGTIKESRTEVASANSSALKGIAFTGSVFTAVGGACLHLIGTASNEAYFRRWGLESANFRLPTDEVFIRGYEALWTVLSTGFFSWFRENLMVLLFYGVVGVLLYFYASLSTKVRNVISKKINVIKKKSFVKHSVLASFAFLISGAVIPVSLLFILTIALFPLSIARQYANMEYEATIKEFKTECQAETTNYRCVSLRNNGLIVAVGYMIGTSDKFTAIYDPAQKRIVLIERPGNIVMTLPYELLIKKS